MKSLSLVLHPDPVLRNPAQRVPRVGLTVQRLFGRMLVAMRRWNGVGLAGPQVGIGLRVITAESEGEIIGLANPVVIERQGEDAMVEGCLSLPGTEVEVTRSASLWVRALDTENRKIELKLRGLLARIVQHEIDHLDGVLIIDRGPAIALDHGERGAPSQ